ncbi:DUF6265 family protein [Mucilaginibacter agri]|uniref:DUF6265 domain-containing protein n=1 Tax=Mucilaginibacter agri TaxID=2695265 RepID=A0A966DT09_9SPHI|nr:DUF6265 family protein [Mucilaginibacter agri]NCD68827.1 hypothetical protein [Mucilaginibacter agri]
MKASLFVGVCFLLLFCGWAKHDKPIRKADWLVGTWENKTTKGSVFETWTKVSDDELRSKSYMLKGKDTVMFETVRLTEEHDQLFYIPTVPNQNGGLPVRFKLKSLSDSQMIFENPEHDFPQVITYTKVNQDSLVAEISGMLKGQMNKRSYPMRRIE